MSVHTSSAELRKMPLGDLRKESDRRRLDIAKMRLGVGLRTQKDTARFRREKRELARMLTVVAEMASGAELRLKPKRKTSTVPARTTGRSSLSA